MTITNLLYGKRRKNSSMLQNIFKNVHHGFTAEFLLQQSRNLCLSGEKTYAKSSPKVATNKL
jgi:hypothetical protein